ncbi:MAG: hypothetical protein ACRDR6_20375 [Pseudonocardiaceae bacterium]
MTSAWASPACSICWRRSAARSAKDAAPVGDRLLDGCIGAPCASATTFAGADFLQLGASGTYGNLGLFGGGSAVRQLLGRLNPDAIQLNGKALADQTGP